MFKQLQQLISTFGTAISRSQNSMSLNNEFLRYGNKKMVSNWSDVTISDQDLYSGYSYAAIRNRANLVAQTAIANLNTEEKSNSDEYNHPYIDVIDYSPTFSEYAFWHDISVFMDLEGVYYLMAIRAVGQNKVGDVMEFKMLNPYHIRRVLTPDGLNVEAYVETRNGMVREIPKEMIIEIRDLNPFDFNVPYAMTDAAKESQFTLKTAGNYTRDSLTKNINAPGIITTDIILPPEQFKNFVSRMKNHSSGEPIFGNGSGAVDWKAMDIDLSKVGLDKINEVQRDLLFSVMGMSKTMMNIEQSGVTRESGKVQRDIHMEGQTLPRIQLIIDALNQDYKNNYPDSYKKTEALITVKNPNATDLDADLKETDVKSKQFDLYQSLINKGYDEGVASKYVKGQITLDMLGKPKNKPVMPLIAPIIPPVTPPEDKSKDNPPPQKQKIPLDVIKGEEIHKHGEGNQYEVAHAITLQTNSILQDKQSHLQNAIVNVEEQLTAAAINKVTAKMNKTTNALSDDIKKEDDLVTKREQKDAVNELVGVLTIFYGIVMNLQGGETMRDRMGEFAMGGDFILDKEIKAYIKETAQNTAESHVSTVVSDLFEIVRQDALKGLGLPEIITNIREKYTSTIVQSRAKAIARTETNRAFTRAQYEADRQFIDQNKLHNRAFKRWITRSENPCEFCSALQREGLIPFKDDFRSMGEDVRAGDKVLKVGFEDLSAGNAHTNCSCIYELVIENDLNHLTKIAKQAKSALTESKKVKQEVDILADELLDLL